MHRHHSQKIDLDSLCDIAQYQYSCEAWSERLLIIHYVNSLIFFSQQVFRESERRQSIINTLVTEWMVAVPKLVFTILLSHDTNKSCIRIFYPALHLERTCKRYVSRQLNESHPIYIFLPYFLCCAIVTPRAVVAWSVMVSVECNCY
jgi:hypothetical protein